MARVRECVYCIMVLKSTCAEENCSFIFSRNQEISFNNNAMKFFVLEVENCLCVTLPRTKMISFYFSCETNLDFFLFCCRLATAAFLYFFVGSLWWLFLPSVLLQSHDDGFCFKISSDFLKTFLTKNLCRFIP